MTCHLKETKINKIQPRKVPDPHAGKVSPTDALAEVPAKRPVARPGAPVSTPPPGQTPVRSPDPKKPKVDGENECKVVVNLEKVFDGAGSAGSSADAASMETQKVS